MIESLPVHDQHASEKKTSIFEKGQTVHKTLTNKTRMKYTDRQLNKQAEIMTIRQTNRQRDGQTDKVLPKLIECFVIYKHFSTKLFAIVKKNW